EPSHARIGLRVPYRPYVSLALPPTVRYDLFFFLMRPRHQRSTLFPYTTLFRSSNGGPSRPSCASCDAVTLSSLPSTAPPEVNKLDRKSTRLNSSHVAISYAVFCLKKKKTKQNTATPATIRRALQNFLSLYAGRT